jgi:hypothetical protein
MIRHFCMVAKKWWQDFLSIHPSFENRNVQLVARCEEGFDRSVGCFVHPARTNHFDSPLECLRFVSLIAHDNQHDMGKSGSQGSWFDLTTFLVIGRGHESHHARLLCSLLLGMNNGY